MHKHYTNNTNEEVTKVEEGEVVKCLCCNETLAVGVEYTETSTEVRFFAGEYMVEHDYEVSVVCESCEQLNKLDEEEWEDEVDETNYDPYAGCDVYEDYGDHDFSEGDF